MNSAEKVFGFFIFLFAVTCIAAIAWREYKHPCVTWGEPKKCTSTDCVWEDEGVCMSWHTSEYDCTECLERKP